MSAGNRPSRTKHQSYDYCGLLQLLPERDSKPIGGPGKVVEIDESKFGKRKYNRGKRVDGCWVFRGIERDSNPPKCFFSTVTDRSAQTLIPIIKRWILPGTTIVSDCWKSYSSLSAEGYIHETVNHSIQFRSDTGAHTNHIESRWNTLKRFLPRFGTNKQLYQSYFAEYCIRRKYLDTAQDKFLESLRLIGSVYRPEPTPELLSQPVPRKACSWNLRGLSLSLCSRSTALELHFCQQMLTSQLSISDFLLTTKATNKLWMPVLISSINRYCTIFFLI